jgi:hypothetical protein
MALTPRILLYASRFFAVCAVLAGFGATVLGAGWADFVCFDTCPRRDVSYVNGMVIPGYFSGGPVSPQMMGLAVPCSALALVALLLFLAYCGLTHQGRRALIALLVALIPPIVGFVAFYYDYTQAATSLPVDSDGVLLEGPIVSFVSLWYVGIGLLLCVWSAALAYVQWGMWGRRRNPDPWAPAPAVR